MDTVKTFSILETMAGLENSLNGCEVFNIVQLKDVVGDPFHNVENSFIIRHDGVSLSAERQNLLDV